MQTNINTPFHWQKLYTASPMGDEPSAPDLLSLFKRALSFSADKPAVLYFDQVITYRDLDRYSTSLAQHLKSRGFESGDRLGLYMQNMPAFFIGALAAWKLGGIAVPFNPMIRSTELKKLLPDCTPKAIVSLDELAPFLRQSIAELDLHADLILCSERDFQSRNDERVLVSTESSQPQAHELKLDEIINRSADEEFRSPALDPLQPAFIVYTSGTTGVPKGVIVTHDNVCWNAKVMEHWALLDRDDGPMLGIAPLFHITGLIVGLAMPLQLGVGSVLTYRFHPGVVLDALQEHRPSFTAATSTAFNALMSSPQSSKDHYSSFRCLVCGGAPLPPTIADAFFEHSGVRLHNGYGLTETSAGVTTTPVGVQAPVDKESGALSVGVPQNNVEIWIAGENGERLKPREIGEIVALGRSVSPGYWNKPEATAEFMREDGFRTGDVGFMDEEGWVYIVDRKKDMISASGYKVWPREVEDTLYQHPAIHEAAVVGVPDEYRGENVKAIVSLKPGATLDTDEFIGWCRERMAAYKVPRIVAVIDELPKNPAGKILRRELRDT